VTLRPLRTYRLTYIRTVVTIENTPTQLVIEAAGRTPCLARSKAFTALERQLVEHDYPRTGWKLISQTRKVM
jgi:hypothetical protein